MSQKTVLCAANFSAAKDTAVVEAIASEISNTPEVYILDLQTDTDHNRSVITFYGPMEALGEALFKAIAKAGELIDLDTHRGQHPRIGASDFIPLSPFEGATLEDCVELAKSVGKRVGEELGIPVYLYQKAATRPDRVNHANIRKGQYETLKETILTDPDKVPDFGPARLGKAGASMIGAHIPLIAFNVYLTTDDQSIASKIARAVRHSSGGLRNVQSLGMLVDGRAQVSMNLLDYTKTPVARVVEFVRREAARYGVGIHHSELCGLIPQAALTDAAQWYLQLDQFESNQTYEARVQTALAGKQEEPSFLEKLASSDPTPGGGSAAAHTAAMAASLVAMVARLTLGRKKYAAVEGQMDAIVEEADALRIALENAVALDAQAFDAVMAAFRLPKGSDEQKVARDKAIEQATHVAAEVPLKVAHQAVRLLELAADAAAVGNTNAITDAGSAGALSLAALTAAGLNVKINAASVCDKAAAESWLQTLAALDRRAQEANERLKGSIIERGGIDA